MNIFERRTAFKPFEYPELTAYKEAINHSYWLVSEWNFVSDVQDFNTRLSAVERSAVKNTLLAISQIEVGVKKFWAKVGDRFPKAEVEFVGATFAESECYDEKTEVLTSTGWTPFADVTPGHLVAQYDHESGEIGFVYPQRIVARPYQGVMHHYRSVTTDLMVTPNHEILVRHPQKETYVKRRSVDGEWSRNYRYPTAGYAAHPSSRTFSPLDRLLIAIQADGSLYGCTPSGVGRRGVSFNLKKSRKIERLRSILTELGVSFKESARSNGFTAFNFQLGEGVDVQQIKNFEYVDLTGITAEWGQQFLEEVGKWDSTQVGDTTTYYNANEEAVDKVQAIAALSGFTTHKYVNRDAADSVGSTRLPGGKPIESAKTVFALSLRRDDKRLYPHREEVPYNGMVYCVTVPSGSIVVRRNDRVAVCGNCRHADAYSHLLQVLSLNAEFEQLLQNPVIQGRVDYLTKYLKGASDNSDQNYTLTLTLFSLFIENVSLFSQFLIIKAFNKHKNCLKDIDNVVQATQKEEQIHALFGVKLIEIVKRENPEWFNDQFYAKLSRACKKAFEAECKIIDWIFEAGDLPFLSVATVKEFTKNRFNESLRLVGGEPLFEVDDSLLKPLRWFEEEIHADANTDFFHKKPVTYSKKVQAITAEDIF